MFFNLCHNMTNGVLRYKAWQIKLLNYCFRGLSIVMQLLCCLGLYNSTTPLGRFVTLVLQTIVVCKYQLIVLSSQPASNFTDTQS
jgi:hypothetical protein